jgi:hypothetical protein
VLHWLMEAAEQLHVFSVYFLHDFHLTQVQLDALYAVLRAGRAGKRREAQASAPRSTSPHWVWTAIDPLWKAFHNGSYRR